MLLSTNEEATRLILADKDPRINAASDVPGLTRTPVFQSDLAPIGGAVTRSSGRSAGSRGSATNS